MNKQEKLKILAEMKRIAHFFFTEYPFEGEYKTEADLAPDVYFGYLAENSFSEFLFSEEKKQTLKDLAWEASILTIY